VGKVLYDYKGTMPAKTVINNIRTDTVAIAKGAFAGCENLTSITIPASVTSIGKGAFFECSLTPAVHADIIKRFGEDPFNHPYY